MRNKVTRAAGLAGLAAAVLTGAGALAVAAGGATPALAGIEDTGGTASITVSHSTVNGLARAGIVVLPEAPGGASVSRTGREIVTLQVSGGDGNFVGTAGSVDLAGGLVFTDGATRLSVAVTKLVFNYSTGTIGGVAGTRSVTLVSVGGALSGSSSAGPPATQTFTASALLVTKAGARYLNTQLHTKYFKQGQQIGSFATTYETTTS